MKTIEEHIQKDKEILADPNTSEPMRHHPNALELFCEMHPDEPECLVYDD